MSNLLHGLQIFRTLAAGVVMLTLPTAMALAGARPTAEDFAGGPDPVANTPEFGAPAKELPADARVEDIVEPSADYHYAGFGKADPFQPPVAIKAIVPDAVEIPIVSPLQRYSLSELKLVGVWARSSGERKALVMSPSMEGIIVKVGDLVGNGGGKVLSIDEGSVVVREFLIANDGTRQFSDVRLLFDTKPATNQKENAGGTIVIAPGAAKPELQGIPASGSRPGSAPGAGAPQAPAGQPANQTPANLIPGGTGVAGQQGSQQTAPAAQPAGGTAGTTPGTGGGTTPAPATTGQTQPKPAGNGPYYNF